MNFHINIFVFIFNGRTNLNKRIYRLDSTLSQKKKCKHQGMNKLGYHTLTKKNKLGCHTNGVIIPLTKRL